MSRPYDSTVSEDSFSVSGAFTVGGENNPFIVIVISFVIDVKLLDVNFMIISWFNFTPTQLTELTSVDTTLQLLTLSISKGWFSDTSSDHCKVTGKSITKIPFIGMTVFGLTVIIMSPDVFVVDGENVSPQDLN